MSAPELEHCEAVTGHLGEVVRRCVRAAGHLGRHTDAHLIWSDGAQVDIMRQTVGCMLPWCGLDDPEETSKKWAPRGVDPDPR